MRMTRDDVDDNYSSTQLHQFAMDSSASSQQQQQQQQQSLAHQNGSNNVGAGGGGNGNNGQLGGGGGLGANNKLQSTDQLQQQDNQVNSGLANGGAGQQQQQQHHQYTMPGVLFYIQHEFSRFEMERSQWDIDRAEFQARIAVLLGEHKGHESLKSDLTRRIKMLEYALKQERAKFHRLKFGCDPPTMNQVNQAPVIDDGISNDLGTDSEMPFSSVSNTTWRQGRHMLRTYLQEIGYTDTIIDVRSNRVRALLGLNNNAEAEENIAPSVNGNDNSAAQKRASESQGRRTPAKKSQTATVAEAEAAVLAALEFLDHPDVGMSESDDDDIADGLDMGDTDNDDVKLNKRTKVKSDDVDAEAEEVLNELNLLTESEDSGLISKPNKSEEAWSQNIGKHIMSQLSDGRDHDMDASRRAPITATDEDVDASLGLGELAQLSVNNEDEANTYDVANTKEQHRKTWNAKYTLRSHFDGVRALAFHPQEPVLITASEDHTLKLWNLQKTVLTKKSAGLDVEPLYTFRAHTGPVLCLAMSTNGEQCYSGGLDGSIHCWNLPNSNIDPYDSYEPKVLRGTLDGHTDAIWGLAFNHTKGQLVSCSADGSVKLWSPLAKMPLLNTFASEAEGVPSSVDFVRDEADRIVVAYNNVSSHCIIYDTETAKPVVRLESAEMNAMAGRFINKVVSHPTLPISITAHEDRHIRFWDNTTGTLMHSMVAHLEPVTSLAIDAHGLYLLSGSHDCSIRLWNLDNKTCVQEITAHRKKFDESIFDVAFHPYRAYIASAGADALAKVFV